MGTPLAASRSLAKELGPRKIRGNAWSLGPVATEGYAAAGFPGSDFEKQAVQRTPPGRLGRPQEIASVAAFLASDDARWASGAGIDVSGGWSRRSRVAAGSHTACRLRPTLAMQ